MPPTERKCNCHYYSLSDPNCPAMKLKSYAVTDFSISQPLDMKRGTANSVVILTGSQFMSHGCTAYSFVGALTASKPALKAHSDYFSNALSQDTIQLIEMRKSL